MIGKSAGLISDFDIAMARMQSTSPKRKAAQLP